MRKKVRERIKSEIRKEKLRKLGLISIVFLVVVILGLFAIKKIPKASENMVGIVNSHHADQHYIGSTSQLLVKVPGEKTLVIVKLPKHEKVKLGETVELSKNTSFLTNSKWYTFVRYVEDETYNN